VVRALAESGREDVTIRAINDLGPIRVSAERDPEALDWGDIDIVLEWTGLFTDREAIGITRGFMTGVHSYTGDQPTLDRMRRVRGSAARYSRAGRKPPGAPSGV